MSSIATRSATVRTLYAPWRPVSRARRGERSAGRCAPGDAISRCRDMRRCRPDRPRSVLRRDQAEAVAKGICAARQAAPVARLLALDDSAEPGDLRCAPPDVLNGKIEVNRRPVSGE